MKYMDPDDAARKERARERAERVVLHKGKLGDPEIDFSPIRGESAISLATRLSSESHSLSGTDLTRMPRNSLPVRFVPRARR